MLSVLSCKYVDEVIIGAPLEITQDLITTMNISIVARSSRPDSDYAFVEGDAFGVPTKLGILRDIDVTGFLSSKVSIVFCSILLGILLCLES